jgi:Hypervirulence associated proteins TUDOR domain
MTPKLKRGDRVEWSFRGRPVVGRVQRRLTARTEIAGQVVAASPEDPRYVVKTEKSGRLTTRRPAALRKLRR